MNPGSRTGAGSIRRIRVRRSGVKREIEEKISIHKQATSSDHTIRHAAELFAHATPSYPAFRRLTEFYGEDISQL